MLFEELVVQGGIGGKEVACGGMGVIGFMFRVEDGGL